MMHKQIGLVTMLVLGIALSACKGESATPPSSPASSVTPTVDTTSMTDTTRITLTPVLTVESDDSVDYTVYKPGLLMQSGLTMLTYSAGVANGTAYFYGEVRNDTGRNLNQAHSLVYALDAGGYLLATANANPLIVDIPPGQVFYVGTEYPAPEGYADAQLWVRYTAGEPAYTSYYGLPATVEQRGQEEGRGYVVRGTAQNNTGRDLFAPVIDVALIGPDDNLVGLGHGVIVTGLNEHNIWPAEAVLTFEVPFNFASVPFEQVQDVRVLAVGYAAPQ